MQARVETLAECLDLADTEVAERLFEKTSGRTHSFDQCGLLERLGTLGGGANRPLEIVGNDQQLARKIRDRVLPHLLCCAFSASPDVFRVCKRTQQAIP